MSLRLKHFIPLILLLLTSVSFSGLGQQLKQTYVEPSLLSLETETISVIVTAQDAQAAAQAVERLGGQVKSDLWLIQAVAATLPAKQLAALEANPDIVSIVDNKGVEKCSGTGRWLGDRSSYHCAL